MGKPIHPAIVHFPIALLLTSFALDGLHAAHAGIPAPVASLLPLAHELPRLAYLALCAGLLSAVPAALSGIQQAVQLVNRVGGAFDANGGIKPKVAAVGIHAAVNDVVILGAGYVWWARRAKAAAAAAAASAAAPEMSQLGEKDGSCGGAAAWGEAYAAEQWVLLAEAALGALLLLAANMGGSLTYKYGIGMVGASGGSGGSAKKKM